MLMSKSSFSFTYCWISTAVKCLTVGLAIITIIEVNYCYLERGGVSISLTLRFFRSHMMLSDLNATVGPGFIII